MAARLWSRTVILSPQLKNVRFLQRYEVPQKPENVELEPMQRRLAILEKQPVYPHNVRPMKVHKELINIRGDFIQNAQIRHRH